MIHALRVTADRYHVETHIKTHFSMIELGAR